MPSTSKPQAKLMNIAAHTPGGYGGVSQAVGKEFHAADKKVGKFNHGGAVKAGSTAVSAPCRDSKTLSCS